MSKVAILLTPGFADWEYGLIAGTGRPFYGLDVRFFASPAGTIASQGELTATVRDGVDALASWRPHVVVVVGGTIWETEDAPDLRDLLAGLYDGGAVIAGICAGTLALGRAGLLDRVRHTSNDAAFLAANADGYRGAAAYVESASAVTDGRIVTAPGTAPASFAAAVLTAAGVPAEAVSRFRGMMAAEHA